VSEWQGTFCYMCDRRQECPERQPGRREPGCERFVPATVGDPIVYHVLTVTAESGRQAWHAEARITATPPFGARATMEPDRDGRAPGRPVITVWAANADHARRLLRQRGMAGQCCWKHRGAWLW